MNSQGFFAWLNTTAWRKGKSSSKVMSFFKGTKFKLGRHLLGASYRRNVRDGVIAFLGISPGLKDSSNESGLEQDTGGQPSDGAYRKQHMPAIIKEGWRLLAVKQTVLLVDDDLTAFGFASDLGMQSYLLWPLALPLQLGW